jgi:hypothetical protein
MSGSFALKTAAGSYPSQGNRELYVNLNFTNVASITSDLFQEMEKGKIESIQSVFVDNSTNPNPLTIVFNQLYTLVVQPFKQGIFPVIAQGKVAYVATTPAGVQIPVFFSNTDKTFAQWGP